MPRDHPTNHPLELPALKLTPATETSLGMIIGADSLRGRRSGVGRMTLEIIQAISGRPEIDSLRLLVDGRLHHTEDVLARLEANPILPVLQPSPNPPPTSATRLQRAKFLIGGVPGIQRLRAMKHRLAQRADLTEMARAARGHIVYHEPNMIPQPFDGRIVATMNDLSWHHHPEYHPAERLAWIGRNLHRTLDTATRFVAISQFTANAMVQELGVDPAKIDVVALGAGPQFIPVSQQDAAPALATQGLEDQSYILSVSTLEPRKNFDRLMAAHLALPASLRRRFPLVIVGGSGWGSTLASAAAERARQDGSLRLLGHVADADLVALYARSALFAYVSIYEGFGLPIIEAMATGAPVLASSTTATGETAGQAAALVDPLDVAAITEGIRRILEDATAATDLRTSGLAHARSFTWDRTATELIHVWRQAAA